MTRGPRLAACAALVLALHGPAVGADEDPKDRAEAFFEAFREGEAKRAFELLFAGSALSQDRPEAIERLLEQSRVAIPTYGGLVDHDLLLREKCGKYLVRLVYLLATERSPTFWEFYFYRPDERWFLVNVTFNDQFLGLGSRC